MPPASANVDAQDGIMGNRRAAAARASADAAAPSPKGNSEKEVGSSRDEGVLSGSAWRRRESGQRTGHSDCQAVHGGQGRSGGVAITASCADRMHPGEVLRGTPYSCRKSEGKP